jgi:flagellar motor protein MotB
LLVIEGQASKDNYSRNYELSYERALALRRLWSDNNIDFGNNCEVLISGSGIGGSMRENEERLNQRFLIHIVPKPGIVEESKSK